jgi:hypothetical protein
MTAPVRLYRLKTLSGILATWVTIFAAISAGLFSLYEYKSRQKLERVSTTLRYMERFDELPLHGARTRLTEFWYARARVVFRFVELGEEHIAAYVLETIDSTPSVRDDTVMMVQFFDGLHACVCSSICDEASALRLFGKEAYDLHGLNYPFLEDRRKQLHDRTYGRALSDFGMTYAKKPPRRLGCEAT